MVIKFMALSFLHTLVSSCLPSLDCYIAHILCGAICIKIALIIIIKIKIYWELNNINNISDMKGKASTAKKKPCLGSFLGPERMLLVNWTCSAAIMASL